MGHSGGTESFLERSDNPMWDVLPQNWSGANSKTYYDLRPSSFHTLPKLDWCGSWGCNLDQSLSNHGPQVFYRRKIRKASLPGKQFNLVIDEEPLDNACHVWLRFNLLKYGCGQALKVKKDNWIQHFGDVALVV
ncbi:uncharacterized protein TNCV_4378851 [Trichonephila clavipes]|nr:uncharacterized protein TNCV_4378851 [Trichonephila clavipes]